MAWHAMRSAALLLTMTLLAALPSGARGEDPNALLRSMAAKPLRYGGVLRGPVNGRLLLGLDEPAADGSVQGEAMLVTDDWHLIDTASVSGTWAAMAVPGGHDCTLRLSLPGRSISLDGVCAHDLIAGEILNKTDKDWLSRQIFWWDGGDSRGRYWLTTASFYR